ncbi:innexin inx3-like [Palaemon carinicauda]|uniref:innexin inx3-like n=1 Tax=Palaemon carinicauda TaxID=392227 RepID=UPI0035B5985E
MVLHIFAGLAGLVKVRVSHTDTDSHVFRLHYRLTSTILFLACLLVAATEYIGQPIQCTSNGAPVDPPINTFCWISSTFTINTTTGLGNHEAAGAEKTYHAYYQWVPFILFIQGCMFYLPHLFWKAVERKTVDTLLQGLDYYTMDPDQEKKKENIIKYLKSSEGQNGKYSLIYHLFEGLNFVNVIGQIFILNDFFGGAFLKFGTEVVDYAIDDSKEDPFRIIFPKVTKCTFNKYGPSGNIEHLQPLCILPQNILNEKVFVILWFWFIILATITGMQLVYRLVVCYSPFARVRLLEQRGKLMVNDNMQRAIQRLHLGDFFLLDILGRNLDGAIFKDIMTATLNSYEPEPKPEPNAGLYPPLPSPVEAIEFDRIN